MPDVLQVQASVRASESEKIRITFSSKEGSKRQLKHETRSSREKEKKRGEKAAAANGGKQGICQLY